MSTINPIKTALITGASKGIGRAIVEKFASEGTYVIAVARSTEELNTLAETYTCVKAITCDISTPAGRAFLLENVGGKIDYLLHNAGIESHIGGIEILSEEGLNAVMQTNALAPMALTAGLVKGGFVDKTTRILGTSSRAGDQGFPNLAAYCTSKTALDAFMRGIVVDGYLAATIVPGEVDTHIQETLREGPFDSKAFQQFFIDAKNEGRLLSPATSAKFFHFVLTQLSDKEFTGKKHNVYDTRFWHLWLGPNETIPTPAGEREQNMRTRFLDPVDA